MTGGRVVFLFVLTLAAVLGVDAIYYGGQIPVFLGKKFLGLIEYLAFWR